MRRRLAVVAFALFVGTAGAQPVVLSRTTGPVIGGNGAGMSVSTDDARGAKTTDNGAGGGGLIGWGFTPNVTGLLRFNQAAIAITGTDGDYTDAQVDVGVRFHFLAAAQRARPYVEALGSGRRLQFSVTNGITRATARANGIGVTAGGGLQVYFVPAVALDLGLDLTFGNFGDWKYQGQAISKAGQLGATGGLFRVGLNIWPGLAR